MKKRISKEKLIIIKFTREIYVINNLKVNLLIKINLLKLEDIIINLFNKNIIFSKYENIAIFV